MGRAGLEPATLGLKVPLEPSASTNKPLQKRPAPFLRSDIEQRQLFDITCLGVAWLFTARRTATVRTSLACHRRDTAGATAAPTLKWLPEMAGAAASDRRRIWFAVAGAVVGVALGILVSVTTDVPLAPEAGLLLGALVGRFWAASLGR